MTDRYIAGAVDRAELRELPARQEVLLHFHGVSAEDVAEALRHRQPRSARTFTCAMPFHL